MLGIEKSGGVPAAREDDGRSSANGTRPPAVQPTDFHQQHFRHKYYLTADPKQAKKRLVFKTKAERQAYEAMFRARKNESGVGDGSQEAQETEDMVSEDVQEEGESSQMSSPSPIPDSQDSGSLQSPVPAVTSDQKAHPQARLKTQSQSPS